MIERSFGSHGSDESDLRDQRSGSGQHAGSDPYSGFDVAELKEIRRQFPALDTQVHGNTPLIYLDSAATALKSAPMIEATTTYYKTSGATVHRGVHALSAHATDAYERARMTIANWIHAKDPQEVIFTKGATEGINLVASGFCQSQCQPGDEIVISQLEHHANILPWQMEAEKHGLQLTVIPLTPEGDWDLSVLSTAIHRGRVRLIALSGASNVLGDFTPILDVIQHARLANIPVLVDASQWIVHEQIDVQKIDCDFLVFSGHKLGGPTGIGVLYGKRDQLDRLAPYQTGGHMIQTVSFERSTFQSGAARFEAGSPNVAGVLGLAAAIEYLDKLSMSRIHAHLVKLSQRLYEGLSEVPGLRILGRKGVHDLPLYACVHERHHAYDVATLLDLKGVAVRDGHHCAMPLHQCFGSASSFRVSAWVYNTMDEINLFLDYLSIIIRKLGG